MRSPYHNRSWYLHRYGPWDRPDMALQKFAQAIIKVETIKVFDHENHRCDFTYIHDIVEGISRVLDRPAPPNLDWSMIAQIQAGVGRLGGSTTLVITGR